MCACWNMRVGRCERRALRGQEAVLKLRTGLPVGFDEELLIDAWVVPHHNEVFAAVSNGMEDPPSVDNERKLQAPPPQPPVLRGDLQKELFDLPFAQ